MRNLRHSLLRGALLLGLGQIGNSPVAQAQNVGISSFQFSSVSVQYPANPHSTSATDPLRPFSVQGGAGHTFSTVEKPASVNFGLKPGFAQTQPKFAYKGHLDLEDFFQSTVSNITLVPVLIRLYSGLDGSIVDELDGYTDSNGNFTLYTYANPAPRIGGVSYLTQVSAKATHWLRQRLTPVQPTTLTGYPSLLFTLINGDANGDNVVDTLDNVFVAHHMQSRYGDPKYDPNADLNNDGMVTPLDLQIIHKNRGTHGDD